MNSKNKDSLRFSILTHSDEVKCSNSQSNWQLANNRGLTRTTCGLTNVKGTSWGSQRQCSTLRNYMPLKNVLKTFLKCFPQQQWMTQTQSACNI